MTMKLTILRRAGVFASAVAVLFSLALTGHAAPNISGNDLVDFQAAILAEDPFSAANKVDAPAAEFRRGETVRLTIIGTLKPHAYTYPMTQRAAEAQSLLSIEYDKSSGLTPLWPITETQPEWKITQDNKGTVISAVLAYKKSPFAFEQDLLIQPDATPGPHSLKLRIKGQACNDQSCYKLDYPLEVKLNIAATPPAALTSDVERRLKEGPPQSKVIPYPPGLKFPGSSPAVSPRSSDGNSNAVKAEAIPISETAEQYRAGLDTVLSEISGTPGGEVKSDSLWSFILAGIFWGGVSLITPCVFPMIPITVSFFLKQSEKQHHKPVTMALVYCGTIVVVLTIAAVALLSFFRLLSVNPLMNFGLGILFVFFALSLFGMYDIELPSGLARFTSQREGQGGLVGTMFMALTFTIVSFACVAPFLGGFGGTAAGSNITLLHRILGGLAFAATFASPFFVLALFPNLLKKMPKSGSWLNSVKVVMGFLELAAALKFFRAGELVYLPTPTFFTYDLVLGLWIAMALLCGLYLLNLFRLPHDSPLEHIGVMRMLFGLAFVGLSLYLLPAQFKVDADGKPQRPNGTIYAWIDSFLLPEPNHGKGELDWTGNLKKAIDEARAEAKKTGRRSLVFVDFTGETCTNCKINENNVFTKPDIRSLFQRYRLVQLFTDKVPDQFYSSETRARFGGDTARQIEDARANLWFQQKAFNTEQLPLYVILEPTADGKVDVLGKYDEGKINDDAAFAQFLKKPLEAATATAQVSGR
jgi:thiol:disulfide interchange protein